MNRIQYEVDDLLAEELRKRKADEIIARGQKEWDKKGQGNYKHFMLGYWREIWDTMEASN